MLLFAALLALTAPAQTLQLLSEFRRVDPKGELRLSDAAGKPREILSPGLIRNGFYSLRVVIRPPKGQPYTLDLAQNPENSVILKLYREVGDTLLPVKTPVTGVGAAPESFWLDMQVPAAALVRRVRVEVDLHDGDTWHMAPMELRILRGILPALKPQAVELLAASKPSDEFARQAWREWLCAVEPKPAPRTPGVSARGLIYRNALQDVALARILQIKFGREELLKRVLDAFESPSQEAFCGGERPVSPLGPDGYLRVRDLLNREASRQ
ncbi:MAG: hypothetical protein JNK87_08475 [Bryobacterales bacterium]|nr:hypothetical protein [Bryobacterales bacterium]